MLDIVHVTLCESFDHVGFLELVIRSGGGCKEEANACGTQG